MKKTREPAPMTVADLIEQLGHLDPESPVLNNAGEPVIDVDVYGTRSPHVTIHTTADNA